MSTETLSRPADASAQRIGAPAWIAPNRRLRLLRAGMRALGAIHPPSAAALMDRLWFSPPRLALRAPELATLDSGTRLPLSIHGRKLAAWAWGDAGPTVVLLHGWGGHAGQLHAFVAPLRAAGFRVVAFDAPAHGASAAGRLGGRRTTFFEFADALEAVTASEPALACIVAHSGGCTATALAMRAGWMAPASLVFVAPFAKPLDAVDGFAHAFGASPQVVAAFRRGVERRLGHPWADLDITTLDDAYKWRRLLVIHDEDDREVPPAQAEAVAASWPLAQRMATCGLGHRRLLREPAVVARALAFLQDGAEPVHAGYQPRDSRHELDAAYAAIVARGPANRPCRP